MKKPLRLFSLFLIRMTLFLIIINIAQQWIHELFHALTCILLGGRVVDSFFSIQGAFITCEHANIPIVHLVLRMSGGLGASIVLWYLYNATIGRWVELRIILLTYTFLNVFLFFIEGFFFDIYIANMGLLKIMALPAFLLSFLILRACASDRKRYNKWHYENVTKTKLKKRSAI